MKTVLGLLALALFAAGVVWVVLGVRKYRARKEAEALREAAFLAELTSAAAKRGKPAAPPATAPAVPTPTARAPTPAARAPTPAARAPAPAARTPGPATPAAAIKGALAQGNSGEAARLFLLHVEQRTTLALAASEWEPLGKALLVQESYLEAAWALHAGALLAGDAVGAQRRLIETATRASVAGRPQAALKLYQTLLAKYPGSEFAEFARAGIRLEEKNLGKG
jgi:hypothetical protein